MSKTIPPLDLMFLLSETADSPKHVSALMTFEPPASGGANVVREIADAYRKARPVAPFTYVSEFSLSSLPSWKTVNDFDLERHLHHICLPAGATHDDTLRLVQTLHETTMDRNRPAFDLYLIEGLPGNAFAFFVKIHHAIVDGISAINLLLSSLNEDPKATRMEPFFALASSTPRPKAPKPLVERAMALRDGAMKQGNAIANLYVGMLKKGFGRILGGLKGGNQIFQAPRTPMNGPIHMSRSIATLSLPLAEMRAAGKAFGGTLNDVAVTVVDAGVHRYLADLGQSTSQPLVAMCPVSLREPGDKEATTKVSAIFAPLGEVDDSAAERMKRVMKGVAAAKAELKTLSKDSAMLYGIAAFGLAEAEAQLSQRRVTTSGPAANFVLSNVPGCATPLYLNGARMTNMFPISTIGAGVGLNATLSSYAGSMDFGFVGNGIALPRLTELARHTRDAFEELKAAAAGLAEAAPTATAPAAAAPTEAAVKAAPRKRAPAAKKSTPAKKRAARKTPAAAAK
ncbi:wax ester/triacylglycerol synthase family O-acyltransferase [Variovorax rhizosphaerae]|uniref:diacylglycerol O-acyltransferase n=1 Tax=Variovorax rhizosphaerae TaxID=1836200 RepID=A0ABU8WDS9_9BURK